jgi:hypothetical protein
LVRKLKQNETPPTHNNRSRGFGDVNAKNKYGQTPLDLADALARAALFPHNPFVHRRKRTETADLLRKHGGKTGEELKAEEK